MSLNVSFYIIVFYIALFYVWIIMKSLELRVLCGVYLQYICEQYHSFCTHLLCRVWVCFFRHFALTSLIRFGLGFDVYHLLLAFIIHFVYLAEVFIFILIWAYFW